MKNIAILICFLFTFIFARGQNLLSNPGFELYSGCPTGYGQADSAVGWLNVVETSDYYNCGLSTGIFTSNSTAYSGTGFMGFASFGNTQGWSEAIGQNLSQAILPGEILTFSFAAKKPYAGQGTDTCGGVALYGYKNNMPYHAASTHLSTFSNSMLLGISTSVQDTGWQLFTLTFTATDTVNSLAFTVALSPNCYECIFIDDVSIYDVETGIHNFDRQQQINLFPNPFEENLSIVVDEIGLSEIILYDFLSRQILQQTFVGSTTVNTEQLANGLYVYEVKNKNGTIGKGKIIKQ